MPTSVSSATSELTLRAKLVNNERSCAAADSWLTIGETSGNVGVVTSSGIVFAKWSESKGIDVTQGSVFFVDKKNAPKKTRNIVIAQLTVPKGASFDGTLNAQGQTIKGSADKLWDARGVHFHGGPKGTKKCSAASDCPTCPSSLDVKCGAGGLCACQAKHGDGGTNKHTDEDKKQHEKDKKKRDEKSSPPPPPPPPPPTPDSGGGSTGVVVFILLLVIVGGTFPAHKSSVLECT